MFIVFFRYLEYTQLSYSHQHEIAKKKIDFLDKSLGLLHSQERTRSNTNSLFFHKPEYLCNA